MGAEPPFQENLRKEYPQTSRGWGRKYKKPRRGKESARHEMESKGKAGSEDLDMIRGEGDFDEEADRDVKVLNVRREIRPIIRETSL